VTNSERPRDPSATRAARATSTGLRGLPELFARVDHVYIKLARVRCDRGGVFAASVQFADACSRRSLGEKPPNLIIGGKAPRMLVGGKAPRESSNMETIARTPLQLGNYIRQRRRELGLTQEKLAATVGMRQRTVSDIETSAAARFDTVLRTLAALDLELVIRPRTKGSSQDIERLF
jgi:HTH-type transcriptional regulator / antitoxin HipB